MMPGQPFVLMWEWVSGQWLCVWEAAVSQRTINRPAPIPSHPPPPPSTVPCANSAPVSESAHLTPSAASCPNPFTAGLIGGRFQDGRMYWPLENTVRLCSRKCEGEVYMNTECSAAATFEMEKLNQSMVKKKWVSPNLIRIIIMTYKTEI